MRAGSSHGGLHGPPKLLKALRRRWDGPVGTTPRMKKSPLSLVKERFKSKEDLVAAVQKLASAELWLDRVNSVKGLARVPNAKLLRLHHALSDAKQRFGSRDKLIAAILEAESRAKDEGYKARLGRYAIPRLLDLHRAALRRSGRKAKASAEKKAAPAKARASKAKAKTSAKA